MGKILIVDDDPQLRQSFEKLLTEDGHSVKTASSGEAALVLVKAETPDLVIMDVRLPGMDGLEAFRAIHEMEPKLPGHRHDGIWHYRDGHRGHQAGSL